ncbi:MAG: BtrH N-terminal domain-containing protein [Candidatus Cyclobacteriaceae bacterium M2_1C_046]
MLLDFKHKQSAHCENGVTANLLNHMGAHQLTEPLVFGIGAGLFYIYVPFIKINHGPFISYRTMPGHIFKRTCKSLNVKIVRKKFSSEEVAQQELDKHLAAGQPVGCQVGVFNLSYFPPEYRFHFNAHNIVVFGSEDGQYHISDPVMEQVSYLTKEELQKVRFAKGPLAPKGQLYFPKLTEPVTDEQISKAIKSGISRNTKMMLYVPGPIAGVKGVRFTANAIPKWRERYGVRKAGQYLAQLVRMQEEIGTGGGGFRYIYAAFLQQAYEYIPNEKLINISEKFTKAGDLWRSAAVQAAGIYKGRITSEKDFKLVSDYLYEIAAIEKEAFKALKKTDL